MNIDGSRRCEGRALILAVCGICSLNDWARGTKGPYRKHVVGNMTARQVKDGDLYVFVRDILVEALIVEEDMPTNVVV